MAEINWTRESEIWLKDIYDYIAADDAEAAARTVTRIHEKAQLLRNHPRLGHRYESERSREVRILLYEHYRITYPGKARRQHRHSRRFSRRFRDREIFYIASHQPAI